MKRRTRTIVLANVLILAVIALASCGFINGVIVGFRTTIAAGGPLVDRFVASGQLSAAKGEFLKTDFRDLTSTIESFRVQLDAAGGDKLKQIAAAQQLSNGWLAIYNRGHYGSNPHFSEIAGIVSSIVESVLAYFDAGAPRDGAVQSKKQIEQQLKAKQAELEARMR